MPAFMSDWTFWSFVTAATAILLSQLPPVRLWFEKARLDMEIHSTINLAHEIGYSNFQIFVTVLNSGGRQIRVKKMEVLVSRNEGDSKTYPAQGYFADPKDQSPILLTPFSLSPEDEWSHNTNFFVRFPRDEERQIRKLKSALKAHIKDKREMLVLAGLPVPETIEGDDDHVTPLQEVFEQNFELEAGEYRMTVVITGDRASISRSYDFTVFESDENDLRDVAADYRVGASIFWQRPDKQTSIFVPVRETA